MKLRLKNIGKLSEANIEINGITVIAGPNDTGKSTVGKALYSIFNNYYQLSRRVKEEKQDEIYQMLFKVVFMGKPLRTSINDRYDEQINPLIEQVENAESIEDIKTILESTYNDDSKKLLTSEVGQEYVQSIANVLYMVINLSDEEIVKKLLTKHLETEFYNKFCNAYSSDESLLELTVKDKVICAHGKNNVVEWVDGEYDLNTRAVYLDDPFVLDAITDNKIHVNFSHSLQYEENLIRDHKEQVIRLLNREPGNVVGEILTDQKLEKIYNLISAANSGKMHRNAKKEWVYTPDGSDKDFDIRSLSTGLKMFVILRTLLENGSIEKGGTIILDEPEIHLHPEWQLLFAEIIVLLHKEFGLHVLLNTHSPYFLEAIEVYAEKYSVTNNCKYYLSKNDDSDFSAFIFDATGMTEKIYELLAEPFNVLEAVREKYTAVEGDESNDYDE